MTWFNWMMNQPAYIDRMAKWFQLTDSKPFQTPLDSFLPLLETTLGDKLCNQSAYQELTGSLNYLAITSRSDVAFVVSRLCQFNQKPTFIHLNAAKRVLRYVIHTRHFFLKYDGDKWQLQLRGYANADYDFNLVDRTDTSSYSTEGQYHGLHGSKQRLHYSQWRRNIWHYRTQSKSYFQEYTSSQNWASQQFNPPSCTQTIRQRLQ